MTPSSDGADGAGKRTKAETDWVVLLVETAGKSDDTSSVAEPAQLVYTEVGRTKARTRPQAVKAVATGEGAFVAVPARYLEVIRAKSELVVG